MMPIRVLSSWFTTARVLAAQTARAWGQKERRDGDKVDEVEGKAMTAAPQNKAIMAAPNNKARGYKQK